MQGPLVETVNGYTCIDCADANKAQRGINPAKSAEGVQPTDAKKADEEHRQKASAERREEAVQLSDRLQQMAHERTETRKQALMEDRKERDLASRVDVTA